jgi:ParB family chromosome partitioning protein
MKQTNKSKPALGRGMGALLGANIESSSNNDKKEMSSKSGVHMAPISKVSGNKDQPRKIFKDSDLQELSQSIKENGIIQPITVSEEDGKFIVIAGERRLRAARLAGLDSVPVIIKKASQKETLVMAIIENVQRSDLNCVEEALAYYRLMNEYDLTQEEVAKKIGKERSTIANFLRILKLPREVIQMLQKEILSFGHAKVLAAVKSDDKAKQLAHLAAQENWSVRELEKNMKASKATKESSGNPYFNEKLDGLKNKLEQKTGYQFQLKTNNKGAGTISIKFGNEAEFNDIFEYLVKR